MRYLSAQTFAVVLSMFFLVSSSVLAQNSVSRTDDKDHGAQLTDFAGIWIEDKPWRQPYPMRLKLELKSEQDVPQVTVWISYRDNLGGPIATANFNHGRVVWEAEEACAQEFRHAGYNYDKPGLDKFRLGIRGKTLIFERETTWFAPCDGHPAGVEKLTRRMSRTVPVPGS